MLAEEILAESLTFVAANSRVKTFVPDNVNTENMLEGYAWSVPVPVGREMLFPNI